MNTVTDALKSPVGADAGGAQLAPARASGRQRLKPAIARASRYLDILGLAWVAPMARLLTGENPREQLKQIWRLLGIPLTAIVLFLALWGWVAPAVQTSLGAIPGPAQ